MRDLKEKFIVRAGIALSVTIWFGLTGALAGLGCAYVYPAQYRSTGRIVVNHDQQPGEAMTRAAALAATAKSPQTLSTAIIVADLYHSDRDRVPLSDLAGKLAFTADVRPANRDAIVDIAMTYTDREKVQRALDSIIRHMVSEDAPRYTRMGSYAQFSRNASAGIRTGGLEPGFALVAGFLVGVVVHSVYTQMRMPKPAERRLWLQ